MEKKHEVSSLAKWLWRWFYNLKFSGSRPPSFRSLDLFLVLPISSNWPYHVYNHVYNQLVSFLASWTLNYIVFEILASYTQHFSLKLCTDSLFHSSVFHRVTTRYKQVLLKADCTLTDQND